MKLLKLPFKLIFNRLTFAILVLIFQIFVITIAFKFFYNNIVLFFGGLGFFSFIVVAYILICKENTNYKIAWILLVLGFPGIGALIFLFLQLQLSTKIMNKKLNQNKKESLKYLYQNENVLDTIKEDSVKSLVYYMNNFARYPIYRSGNTEYFPFGENKIEDLKKELENAEKFIFLEYFIISKGYVLESIIEILKRKVKEGVEVRLLYDGTCPFNGIPYHYPEMLKEVGIQAKMFSPIKAVISSYQNNRDHRKIAIIDGKVAYTGGINLGDEYINKKIRFGKWKDTAIKIKGEAVNSFTTMFLEMWNIDEKENEEYLPYITSSISETNGYVMPYSDNPLDTENVGRTVYMSILNNAKKYVYIMTPYLILDDELLSTIKYTAKRGIDVKIIMPHVPDKKMVYWLGRSYYEELLKANVKIYEYNPGFVHGKMFISDDDKAVVGTINLDYRSLYLHFECGCFIYQNSVIKKIKEDYKKTLEESISIDKNNIHKFGIVKKIIGVILRFFAPLM